MRLPLRYLCGSFLARFAEEGMGVTMALLALHRTGSVAQAAALSAAWLAPHVLAAPLIGTLAGRALRPARFYAACLAGVAIGMGAATLLLGRVPLWLVLGIAVAGGCCGPAVSGGLSSLVADLLPRRAHDRGYGWDSATYNAASIAGVGAAATVSAAWNAELAGLMLTAAALTATVLIGLLGRTHGRDGLTNPKTTGTAHPAAGPGAGSGVAPPEARPGEPATASANRPKDAGAVPESAGALPGIAAVPRAPADTGANASGAVHVDSDAGTAPGAPGGERGRSTLRSDIAVGLSALWRQPTLRAVTAATCLAYLGIGALTITAVLTARQWGGGDGGGVLLTAFSVGALAGALVLARWSPPLPPQRLAGWCLAVTGVALGSAAVATDLWLGVVLFAIAGAGDGPLLSATLRVRAEHAPRRVRAQVFTTGAALKLSAAALGAGLAGAFESLPPALPLALIAATQLVACVLVWTLAPAPEPAAAG